MEKRRVPKAYRHESLDEELRRTRLRREARLFHEARLLGVSVPILYDIDPVENRVVMEFIEGPLVKEALEAEDGDRPDLCRRMGRFVGKLHAGDLIHGDLTTSNMILRDDHLYVVDFGMGERSAELEAKGVDFHLLQEAFLSAHSELADLFPLVIEGYQDTYASAAEVVAKAKEIEGRGRYLRGS